jgi:hypothetical protein
MMLYAEKRLDARRASSMRPEELATAGAWWVSMGGVCGREELSLGAARVSSINTAMDDRGGDEIGLSISE